MRFDTTRLVDLSEEDLESWLERQIQEPFDDVSTLWMVSYHGESLHDCIIGVLMNNGFQGGDTRLSAAASNIYSRWSAEPEPNHQSLGELLSVANGYDLNPPEKLIDHLESEQYKGVRIKRGDGYDDLHSLALGASHSERIPLDKRLEKVLERDSLDPEYGAHCINLRIHYSDKERLDGALCDAVRLASQHPESIAFGVFIQDIHREGGHEGFKNALSTVVPVLNQKEQHTLLDSLRTSGQAYELYVRQVEKMMQSIP